MKRAISDFRIRLVQLIRTFHDEQARAHARAAVAVVATSWNHAGALDSFMDSDFELLEHMYMYM